MKNLPLVLIATVVAGLLAWLAIFGEGALGPETKYLHAVSGQMGALTKSLENTERLLDVPEPSDSVWRGRLETEIEVWRRTYREAAETKPPSRFQEAHENWITTLQALNNSTPDLIQCLGKPLSADNCRWVPVRMELAREMLNVMDEELRELEETD